MDDPKEREERLEQLADLYSDEVSVRACLERAAAATDLGIIAGHNPREPHIYLLLTVGEMQVKMYLTVPQAVDMSTELLAACAIARER